MLGIGRKDHRVPVVGAIGHNSQCRALGGHFRQDGVVDIEEYGIAVAGYPVIQLALGLAHAFEGAEAKQVGLADIGYEAEVGLGDSHEVGYVIRMAGTHLNHGYLVLLVQTEQRLGYTYIIVKVTLGVEHIVFL